MALSKTKLSRTSFIVLFAAVALLLFFVFAPFLVILSLAAVFAVLLYKPYERLLHLCGGHKNVAAAIMVGLILIFFIVPLFFLGGQIFQEAQGMYASMYGNGAHYLLVVQKAIQSPIQHFLPGFTFSISTYVGNALAFISGNLASLVYQTFFIVFETFLMLLALFFFLRDGRDMLSYFSQISPLGTEMTNEILNKMHQTIGAVTRGTFVNALIRWVCISASFYIFGIPNALLWGSIGGVVGAIPGLGTPFAFIPAIVYAYLQGNILAAIGLAAFGVITVVLVDNILTSYFFGKGLAVSPIFVLFSILGGIAFLGPLGFILGPLVLSVFLSIVRVYDLERSVA